MKGWAAWFAAHSSHLQFGVERIPIGCAARACGVAVNWETLAGRTSRVMLSGSAATVPFVTSSRPVGPPMMMYFCLCLGCLDSRRGVDVDLPFTL